MNLFRWKNLFLAGLFFTGPLFAEINVSDERTGRIYVLKESHAKLSTGTFLIYREMLPNMLTLCVPLSGTLQYKIPFSKLYDTGYFDPVSLEDVNERMVFAYSGTSQKQYYLFLLNINLSKELGSSQRLKYIEGFDVRVKNVYRKIMQELAHLERAEKAIQREIRGGDDNPDTSDRDDAQDSILKALSANNPALKVVRETVTEDDLFLAVSLLQKYHLLISRQLRIRFQKMMQEAREKNTTAQNGITAIWQDILKENNSVLRSVEKEIYSQYQQKNSRSGKRRNQYMQLFPDARGLWTAAMPNTYRDLLILYEKAHQSYLKLADLSSRTDFKEWGACALNMLTFTAGSKSAENLEKEFDGALNRAQRKRTGNTGK